MDKSNNEKRNSLIGLLRRINISITFGIMGVILTLACGILILIVVDRLRNGESNSETLLKISLGCLLCSLLCFNIALEWR